MKPHVRAMVAATAIAHATGKKVSGVYAYGEGGYISAEVSVTRDQVNGYDYSNSCHFSGSIPNLYHYGQSSHVEFKPGAGGKYTGFDYGESCHFELTVSGSNVSLYDYGAGGHFSFSV